MNLARRCVKLLLGVVFCFIGVVAAGKHPRMGQFTSISLPGQPNAIEDIALGEDGRLFVLDRENARILVYSPDFKQVVLLGAPPHGERKLISPMQLSLCGGHLAVAEHDRVLLFSEKDGSFERAINGLGPYQPGFGFALLPSRLLFTGQGFKEPPPPPGKRVPVQFLTLFSTNLEGKDLQIVRSEVVDPAILGSWQVFSLGVQTSWNGGWVVAKRLPLTLVLLDKEARPIKESNWKEGALPPGDIHAFSAPADFMNLLFATPHADGLIPLKEWLGVLWRDPSTDGSQFKIIWVDNKLNKAGETPFSLPVRLRPYDVLRSIVVTRDFRVLVLLIHRSAFGPGTSELFVSKAEAQ